jgi:hypothetical protein
VREEIQGFLECVGSVVRNWRGLERASRGILEPVLVARDDGCEYCRQGHRKWDCELPDHGRVELDLREICGLEALPARELFQPQELYNSRPASLNIETSYGARK